MVAYSFQKRFVEPIRKKTKRQTIRANGKRRHARPGEMIQLYAGMRTKSCEKICDDVRCLNVVEVRLAFQLSPWKLKRIQVDQNSLSESEFDQFAKDDGFASADEMSNFWRVNHGLTFFAGVMIQWGDD